MKEVPDDKLREFAKTKAMLESHAMSTRLWSIGIAACIGFFSGGIYVAFGASVIGYWVGQIIAQSKIEKEFGMLTGHKYADVRNEIIQRNPRLREKIEWS